MGNIKPLDWTKVADSSSRFSIESNFRIQTTNQKSQEQKTGSTKITTTKGMKKKWLSFIFSAGNEVVMDIIARLPEWSLSFIIYWCFMQEQPSRLLIETWNLRIDQVFLRLIITLILDKIKKTCNYPMVLFRMHY